MVEGAWVSARAVVEVHVGVRWMGASIGLFFWPMLFKGNKGRCHSVVVWKGGKVRPCSM